MPVSVEISFASMIPWAQTENKRTKGGISYNWTAVNEGWNGNEKEKQSGIDGNNADSEWNSI